jgi:hypothetical protein
MKDPFSKAEYFIFRLLMLILLLLAAIQIVREHWPR